MIINIVANVYDKLDDKKSKSIEHLFNSFMEGKHIILAKKNFLNNIIKSKGGLFSNSIKTAAAKILSKQSEYTQLLDIVNIYVEVNFDLDDHSHASKFIERDNNTFVFECGWLYFNDSEKAQKVNIICEGINEMHFFDFICNDYKSKINNIKKIPLKYDHHNGGGSSIFKVFEKYRDNKSIVFSITDTDKMHPKDNNGSTSNKMIKTINTSPSALSKRTYIKDSGFLKILDVHEIENLIPTKMIEDALIYKDSNTSSNYKETFNFLNQMKTINYDAKYYFDYKKGIKSSDAKKLDQEHKTDFWRPIFKKIYRRYINCTHTKISDCICTYEGIEIKGFGDDILEKVIEYINKHRPYTPDLNNNLKSKWDEIGLFLFSISCSPMKKDRGL